MHWGTDTNAYLAYDLYAIWIFSFTAGSTHFINAANNTKWYIQNERAFLGTAREYTHCQKYMLSSLNSFVQIYQYF